MNKYGYSAVKAARMMSNSSVSNPIDAWELATREIFGKGSASQKKGCPRGAFLGLCEEGFVKNIPAGKYTNSAKNKGYAIQAVKLLKENPGLTADLKTLWTIVQAGDEKTHNSQMNVVVSLWEEGYIK